MSLADSILRFCIDNRVSTTEVSDALGKSGVISGVMPINHDLYRAGIVRVVFAANNSNYYVHEQIRDVCKGDVVIIFTHDCDRRAIIGDLVCKYLLLYKGAAAVVVQGMVRDAASLRRNRYAVWAEAVTPLGCLNAPSSSFPVDLEKRMRDAFEGGIAVCDDGGVTVIPKCNLNIEMLGRLKRIEMQEDIWFFCLDTLKWDTKKIVCDKAYLHESNLLSPVHLEKLRELEEPLDSSNTDQNLL